MATTRPEGGWGVVAPEPVRESVRLMPDAPVQTKRYRVHLNATATEGNRRHFPVNELHLFLDGVWAFDGEIEPGKRAGIDILAATAGGEPMIVSGIPLDAASGELRMVDVEVPALPQDTKCVHGQPCDFELEVVFRMGGAKSGEADFTWTMGTQAFSDMSLRRDRRPLKGAAVTVTPIR